MSGDSGKKKVVGQYDDNGMHRERARIFVFMKKKKRKCQRGKLRFWYPRRTSPSVGQPQKVVLVAEA